MQRPDFCMRHKGDRCCQMATTPHPSYPTPPPPQHQQHQHRHEEVELLVEGLPHLDFGALQAGARYEGGYTEDSTAVKDMW